MLTEPRRTADSSSTRTFRAPAAAVLLAFGLLAGCQTGVRQIGSTEEFQRQVLESWRPAVVTFTASNCPACDYQKPEFGKAAGTHWWRATFAEVNSDAAPGIADRYGVNMVPTVLFFRDGKVIGEPMVGAYRAGAYRQALEAILQGRTRPGRSAAAPPPADGTAWHEPPPNRQPDRNAEKETLMSERTNAITMKGNPLTLTGQPVEIGQAAPDFTVVANDLSDATLGDYAGKTVILASVPSLDTSVCATETRRFNEEAQKLGNDVAVLTISMDLPFAQKRWCGNEGVENVITLSDHRDASFGQSYGVLIQELRLLARAVFVVDRDGKVVYKQLVSEVTDEPDYDEVLQAVRKAKG